jgi:hypothetical protein
MICHVDTIIYLLAKVFWSADWEAKKRTNVIGALLSGLLLTDCWQREFRDILRLDNTRIITQTSS